ncbi:MAG TPA: hypothetical protein VM263_01550, partial [Acidimicrobiales bacterium]|nr:hypothetical protein [Acidimicrobiales bacterium]
MTSRAPVRVAVTGAAGQIGYNLVFRIANGDLLGPDVPVVLQQLEDDRHVGAEQVAVGDPEHEVVADLAGGAGDGHPDGRARR